MLFDDENFDGEENGEARRIGGQWRGEWFGCDVNTKLMEEEKLFKI